MCVRVCASCVCDCARGVCTCVCVLMDVYFVCVCVFESHAVEFPCASILSYVNK